MKKGMIIGVVVLVFIGVIYIFLKIERTKYSMEDVDVFSEDRAFRPTTLNEGSNSLLGCPEGREALGGKCTTREDSKLFSIKNVGTSRMYFDIYSDTEDQRVVGRSFIDSIECLFSATEPGIYDYHIEVHCKK